MIAKTPESIRQHLVDTQPGFEIALLQLPERPCLVRSNTPAIDALPRIIIRQMLSLKASASIIERAEKKAVAFGLTSLAYLPTDELVDCGVSRRKAATIERVAHCHFTQPERVQSWSSMPTAELLHDLTQLKGVGLWTASILAMFHFAHEDIFPIQDSSLRTAIGQLKEQDIYIVPERATPYRSYLACYLWDLLDQKRR